MNALLPLIPALPLLGFAVLVLVGERLPRRATTAVGVGSVGLAAALTAVVALNWKPGTTVLAHAWTWIDVSGLRIDIGFRLDALSLVMLGVITGVGFLIHLYSTEYMHPDEHRRFFAYMNLFVASMLTLVLADNLLLLFLGWEGVGLCSYLLIGFWYRDPANGRAAMKAFWVTRIGDTALMIGLFLLVRELGTLKIDDVLARAASEWPVGSRWAMAVTLLLLGGAVGKSAQLPLQVWLPDAMAGPTPVSALIHAATMVTAGVYLIARLHPLYALAPPVMTLIACIGATTLLLAASSALVQRDLKRALAYSTMSQIGYMFLALGVGSPAAAMFHFMTHAFFKALLFLAAGAVILALHEEHDIYRMGGLRAHMPVTFWTFVIGAAALAGVPLVTSGFFSKDWILWAAWEANPGWWAAGVLGAFLTAIYSTRLVVLVFLGERRDMRPLAHRPGWPIAVPLVVLAFLAVVAGYLEIPRTLGGVPLFGDFMSSVLPRSESLGETAGAEAVSQTAVGFVVLAGIVLGYRLFSRRAEHPAASRGWAEVVEPFWRSGWGFDRLYDALLVRPFVRLATINRTDVIDRFYDGLAWMVGSAHTTLRGVQNGRLRWYAAGIAGGSVMLVTIAVLM